MIRYGRSTMEAVPFIDLATQRDAIRDELDRRIAAVLAHGQYIMGPEVAEMEQALADKVKAAHCISVASGTDALLISLMALGIGPGDEVILPAFTFAATGNSVALPAIPTYHRDELVEAIETTGFALSEAGGVVTVPVG